MKNLFTKKIAERIAFLLFAGAVLIVAIASAVLALLLNRELKWPS